MRCAICGGLEMHRGSHWDLGLHRWRVRSSSGHELTVCAEDAQAAAEIYALRAQQGHSVVTLQCGPVVAEASVYDDGYAEVIAIGRGKLPSPEEET